MKAVTRVFIVLLCTAGTTLFLNGCSGRGIVSLYIDNATDKDVILNYLQYHGSSDTNKATYSNETSQKADISNTIVILKPGKIGHARFWGCENGGDFWRTGTNYFLNGDGSLDGAMPASIRAQFGGEKQFLIADVPSKGMGHIEFKKLSNVLIPKKSIMSTYIRRGKHLLEVKTIDGLLIERVLLIVSEEIFINKLYYNICGANSYRIETGFYRYAN